MWKIKLVSTLLLLGVCSSLHAHPVAFMTGDAILAQKELVMTMKMSMDNLQLYHQISADAHGILDGRQLMQSIQDFKGLLKEGFALESTGKILPEVTLNPNYKEMPAQMRRSELRNYNLEFELRFLCVQADSTMLLVQKLGDRSKGLQTTCLVTFHLDSGPDFIPLYNDIPITIDLEKRKVIEERISPVVKIRDNEIALHIPKYLVDHRLPIEFTAGNNPLTYAGRKASILSDSWEEYIYLIPKEACTIEVLLRTFNWQTRRLEVIVSKGEHEETAILSRFRPIYSIGL